MSEAPRVLPVSLPWPLPSTSDTNISPAQTNFRSNHGPGDGQYNENDNIPAVLKTSNSEIPKNLGIRVPPTHRNRTSFSRILHNVEPSPAAGHIDEYFADVFNNAYYSFRDSTLHLPALPLHHRCSQVPQPLHSILHNENNMSYGIEDEEAWAMLDDDDEEDLPPGYPYDTLGGTMEFAWEFLKGMLNLSMAWMERKWEIRTTT